MPTALPDLILADAIAATGAGLAIGFGTQMRYGVSGGLNQQKFPLKYKVRAQLADTVAASGAIAAVQVQESDNNSSWTTIYTFPSSQLSLSTGTGLSVARSKGFSTVKRYIRVNVSTLSGGTAPTVSAYCTLGSWGI